MKTVEIAVIGAGVVGLATALRLASDGREVVLIDPNEPGSGASFGNAGTIAEYACMPVGNPAGAARAAKAASRRRQPVFAALDSAVASGAVACGFVSQSLPAATRANAVAMAGLLADSCRPGRKMVARPMPGDLLRRNGCLYLYRREAILPTARRAGRCAPNSASDQAALTPVKWRHLNQPAGGAGRWVVLPASTNLTDPQTMMARLLRRRLTGVHACCGAK